MHATNTTLSGKNGALPNAQINDEFGCAGKCSLFECKYQQIWDPEKSSYFTQCGKQNNTIKAHMYVLSEDGRTWAATLDTLHEQSEGHSVDDPIELMSEQSEGHSVDDPIELMSDDEFD